MARDYSSRRNNPPDKNGKRKPTKRATPAARSMRKKPAPAKKKNAKSKPSTRSGAPGCIWLTSGMLIAVVCGSIYYIASRPTGHGPETMSVNLPGQATTAASSRGGASAPKGNTTESPNKPRFSFYKMLPNYKVEVPANARPAATGNAPHEAEPAADTPTPAAPSASSSSNNAASNASKPAASAKGSGNYVIQAGAFSTRNDADRREARLALLGVTANIIDIRTSSGKTIYRVQSSALSTRNKAQNLAQRLKSHGIETMVRQTR